MKVPKLEIKRLQLIEINERHINNLFTIYKDEEVMRYCDCCVHKSIAEKKDLLALFERRIKEGTGISWGVSLKDNPQNIIGTISYKNYVKDFTANIGYLLSKEFWHQGIMMEALNIFIEYGFTKLGIRRMEAHIISGNKHSEKHDKRLVSKKKDY